jgi:hypothetical protein
MVAALFPAAAGHCLPFVYTAGIGTYSNETVNDNFINTSKFTFVNTYISNGTGTHLQLRQNGQPVVVTPQNPCVPLASCNPAIADNSTTGFTVGDREDIIGQDWQGYISEIIVYPTALSLANIQQVEQYLTGKYFLSKGAPFTAITTASKDYSTNINIEGDWKHSYHITDLSKIILSIKDTCSIYEIRIDSVYNEAGNSSHVGSYTFMRRHYTVKYSNGSAGSKKVRLYFSNADFSALQTAVPALNSVNELSVVRYSGPTENGVFDTADATEVGLFLPGQLTTGLAYNNNYIELDTYKLGEFWIYADRTLPVTLLNFTIKKINNWVQLNWSTAQEINSSSFDVERSKNGIQFEKIGSVQAAGNSNLLKNYIYLDKLPGKYQNSYRIKQIDIDNKFVYSPTRSIKFDPAKSFAVYNNPLRKGDALIINLQDFSDSHIEIINSMGQLIFSSNKKFTTNTISIPIPSSASPGQYILKVIDKNIMTTERILIL